MVKYLPGISSTLPPTAGYHFNSEGGVIRGNNTACCGYVCMSGWAGYFTKSWFGRLLFWSKYFDKHPRRWERWDHLHTAYPMPSQQSPIWITRNGMPEFINTLAVEFSGRKESLDKIKNLIEEWKVGLWSEAYFPNMVYSDHHLVGAGFFVWNQTVPPTEAFGYKDDITMLPNTARPKVEPPKPVPKPATQTQAPGGTAGNGLGGGIYYAPLYGAQPR